MGGELGVSSTPGAGSVFAFALELPVVSLPAAPAVVSATGLEVLRGRVLLVDDNDINRLVAAGMLAMLGVTVEQCVNGQEAVDRLRSERFDLVLMDNQMPVLDGLAATRVIRADESSNARSRTPIIGLTANALEGDADRNLHAGMDGHVPKPISVKQLHAVLSKWLPMQPG
jgi:CheY-like chemotaxis protein